MAITRDDGRHGGRAPEPVLSAELDRLVLAIVRAEEALVAAREAYVAAGGSWMWSVQHQHARRVREGGDAQGSGEHGTNGTNGNHQGKDPTR